MTQPIQVHLLASGPNAWKVIFLLEELNLPYTINAFAFADVKTSSVTGINPNGRLPAITDPNTDLVLWESGAIMQYLIEQYDTGHKLSYTDLKQRNLLNQYMFFQMSGQGPYFGQAGWFKFFHSEKIPSAIDRYSSEMKRILGVLESVLAASSSGWLVGDKCTYVDMAFVPYNNTLGMFFDGEPGKGFDGFPKVREWHERMTERQSWKKAMEVRARVLDEQGLLPNGMPKNKEDVTG